MSTHAYPHKYQEKQVLLYEENIYARILERLPWDSEMDFSPVYRVRLVRSGMEMVLPQHDLKPIKPEDLLFNQTVVDSLCDCGAKHTADWNVHSDWCSISEGIKGVQGAGNNSGNR